MNVKVLLNQWMAQHHGCPLSLSHRKPKKSDEIRICVDMCHPNCVILCKRHITPTIDELIHNLNGATVFSKLNLNSGYHQLKLVPESHYITIFSTNKGLQRYTRLNFGMPSAAEVFHDAIQQVLSGIDSVCNVSIDIIIFGRDQAAHDKALHTVFEHLRLKNLTLNVDKCEYNKSSIELFGYVFSGNGVSPDPKKDSAIRIFSNPSTPSNVRLDCWACKLQPYHFTISYSPGKTNPADYLSCHPLATTHSSTASTQAEEYISFLANYTTPKAMIIDQVKQLSCVDPTLQCGRHRWLPQQFLALVAN